MISFLQVPPAHAGFVHWYSVAHEWSSGNVYTGIQVFRTDNWFNLPGSNCNTNFDTPVIYETQWVVEQPNALTWVELGTGHKCYDYRFWFWGFGFDGTWVPVGTQGGIPQGQAHTFKIERTGNVNWRYYIDGNEKGSLGFNMAGYRVSAGFETYESDALAAIHNYASIKRSIYEQPFQLISGFDGWQIDAPLCGKWWTASEWRASQNWGSC